VNDDLLELEITGFAHGGYGVARYEGVVVFVAAALPGETVLARVHTRRKRFWFAVTEVVAVPSPDRVTPPCPLARPDLCGGCDLQHASLTRQRGLKSQVITEQLARLGGLDRSVTVAAVPGDRDGLDWRTRVRYSIAPDGHVGFRRAGSSHVVVVKDCPIATPAVREAEFAGTRVTAGAWPDAEEVIVAAGSEAVAVCPVPGGDRRQVLRESVLGVDLWVGVTGFWQVHPGAAPALASAVLANVAPGARVWDLYAGVGLFSKVLAHRGQQHLVCVEGDRRASDQARKNLRGSDVEVVRSDVARWLGGRSDVDTVVLDPPRSGAGREVLDGISATNASRIVYIACDPAALARDLRIAGDSGWMVGSIEGYDMFPMTHHVECVAVLDR